MGNGFDAKNALAFGIRATPISQDRLDGLQVQWGARLRSIRA
jgi:hypothetical protein